MRLLADWSIRHGGATRKVELLQGDLARLPADQSVDVLVVSAFQNDYLPTQGSLIGALDRAGLSVQDLASHKQVDLRQSYSSWLSAPVGKGLNFRHVLCIETGWRHGKSTSRAAITDDLFRALAPYLTDGLPE